MRRIIVGAVAALWVVRFGGRQQKETTGIRTNICAKTRPIRKATGANHARKQPPPLGAVTALCVVLIRWRQQKETTGIRTNICAKARPGSWVSSANHAKEQMPKGASALWRGSDSVGLDQKRKRGSMNPSFSFGGDNWNRTSDLLHVKQAL